MPGWETYSAAWPSSGSLRSGACSQQPEAERRTSDGGSSFWPTPTQADGMGGPGNSGRDGGLNLRSAVKMLPTPTAQDAANNGGPSQHRRDTLPLNAVVNGQLNPTWVEWLMGWPSGWTVLEPLATASYRQWRREHGLNSTGVSA